MAETPIKKGSSKVEMCLLRTLLAEELPDSVKSYILGHVSSELFAFDDNRAIWDIIQEDYVLKGVKVPSYSVFIENPRLLDSQKTMLSSKKFRPYLVTEDLASAIQLLEDFKTKRGLAELASTLYDALGDSGTSAGEARGIVEDYIMSARNDTGGDDDEVTVGDEDEDDESSSDILNRVLDRQKANLSSTGFRQLDKLLGGGCGEGDLFVVAATTGGGKTVSVFNMLKHVYSVNHENACVISLEMKSKEVAERLMSNLSNVPYSKIKNKTFSDEEAEQIAKSWRRFTKVGHKHGCHFSLRSPSDDVSITKVLGRLTGKGFKWVFIDYINLLSDATGNKSQNEAQALSGIARFAKRWAQQNKCVVVLLAQLDEKTHQVRYARAIKEHANTLLTWHFGEEEREKGICTWHLDKSRGSELGSFDMAMELQFMRILDLDDNPDNEIAHGSETSDRSEEPESEAPKAKSRKPEPVPIYAGDDDF